MTKLPNREILHAAVRLDDMETDLMLGFILQLLPCFSETLRLLFGLQHTQHAALTAAMAAVLFLAPTAVYLAIRRL